MRLLTEEEQMQVDGGLAHILMIAGAIWLGVEVADAFYTAGKAFGEGYNEVRN